MRGIMKKLKYSSYSFYPFLPILRPYSHYVCKRTLGYRILFRANTDLVDTRKTQINNVFATHTAFITVDTIKIHSFVSLLRNFERRANALIWIIFIHVFCCESISMESLCEMQFISFTVKSSLFVED